MAFTLCLFGSILSSWICACASRYESKSRLPWSICPFCSHRLPFSQMIPIFSWIKQKGRCAWCGAGIPIYTIASEVTGILGFFVLSQLFYGKELAGMIIIVCALLYASLCDVLYGLIPDRTHFLIMAGSLFLIPADKRIAQPLFALAMLIVLFLVASVTEGIGMGDVKLIASCSLVLSAYECLCMLSIASTSALLVALVQRKFRLKHSIRFAPYLSSAAFICLCFL